jgi:hypothetical protein
VTASGLSSSAPGYRALAADLAGDLRAVLHGWPARAFLGLEATAAVYIVARRGTGMVPLLAVIAGGAFVAGFLAWFAGRVRGARSGPDPVRAPRAELAAIAVAYVGLCGWFLGFWPAPPWPNAPWPAASDVFTAGLAGWVAIVLLARPRPADFGWVLRGWLPYWPLALAIVLPKLPQDGLGIVPATVAGLGSGIVQQMLLQVGLTSRLEAVTGRRDVAAVIAAVAFGVVHIAMNLPQAGRDWSIAAANAMVLQGTIGLVFCIAYLRHRAPIGLGVLHALLMA